MVSKGLCYRHWAGRSSQESAQAQWRVRAGHTSFVWPAAIVTSDHAISHRLDDRSGSAKDPWPDFMALYKTLSSRPWKCSPFIIIMQDDKAL